jgi:hypothetical protein
MEDIKNLKKKVSEKQSEILTLLNIIDKKDKVTSKEELDKIMSKIRNLTMHLDTIVEKFIIENDPTFPKIIL